MPHPIYGPPSHDLHVVEATLTIPVRENDHQSRLVVVGRSGTYKPALWTLRETWSWTEQQAGLQPTEAAAHALLVAMQDRPTSQQQVEACMIGEGWAQLELDL